ncbi:LOW QUALITY PROTEIN: hypothetical protein OSB04_028711 [Centaurea solstitialis]|uniref:Reverse transcriptase zinc-binding domain-containing protein n=1 Tax=Centaurea solstitialis TaxID=347529 RepID=A0AA38SGA9_9ASTR|nr:LOW QUALITY PROTEIN: hypothetical protein OSB04_028711 [Centaurea solstitialis]
MKILKVGISAVEILRLATIVGCKVGSIPFRYLGLPIGADMHKIANWKPLIERFERKLSDWKARTLSSGGRLCLCKAVLGALGVYFLSLYKAPAGIIKETEKKRHLFLGSKMAWVRWDTVLNSKEKGGLGLGSLRATDISLLAKWWWQFKTQENALWQKVITALYDRSAMLGFGNTGLYCDNQQRDRKSEHSAQGLFQRQIGNDSNIMFWTDRWCGNETLEETWPRLAALDNNRNCTLVDRCEVTTDGVTFRGNWRREPRDEREITKVSSLRAFCSRPPIGAGSSKWFWACLRIFSVASVRKALDDMALQRGNHMMLWNNIVPIKVRIFTWKATPDRLPTKTNLLLRGIDIDNDHCALCNESEETTDHLFFTCRKAKEVRQDLNSRR